MKLQLPNLARLPENVISVSEIKHPEDQGAGMRAEWSGDRRDPVCALYGKGGRKLSSREQ